jgi:hypothetical protein
MDKTFGIAFFPFDRIFGTLANVRPAFNERGYASALSRFGDLVESTQRDLTPPAEFSESLSSAGVVHGYDGSHAEYEQDLLCNLGTGISAVLIVISFVKFRSVPEPVSLQLSYDHAQVLRPLLVY